MAFELKTRSTKKATAPLDGGMIEFEYVPGAYTPALLAKLQAVQTEQTKAEPDMSLVASATSDIVRTVVQSWNVTSGGVPVPITREGLEDVPLDVLNAVVSAMNTGQTPNPTNSPTSVDS